MYTSITFHSTSPRFTPVRVESIDEGLKIGLQIFHGHAKLQKQEVKQLH